MKRYFLVSKTQKIIHRGSIAKLTLVPKSPLFMPVHWTPCSYSQSSLSCQNHPCSCLFIERHVHTLLASLYAWKPFGHAPSAADTRSGPRSGTSLYTDKGYDSAANRHTCTAYGYRDRIFRRRTSNRRRTHAKRRRRTLLLMHRRLILRYERYVDIYMAMIHLACGCLQHDKLKNGIAVTWSLIC